MSILTEVIERELSECEKIHLNYEKTSDRIVEIIFKLLNMKPIKVFEATHSCGLALCQGCYSEGYNQAVEDINRFNGGI